MKTNYKTGICSECTKEALIVHKGLKLCVRCNSNRLRKKSVDKKAKRVKEGKALDPQKLTMFYQNYWNVHDRRSCYECGKELRTFNRWHIHHIIPKKEWERYTMDIVYNNENCIYVCLECHSKAETRLSTVARIEQLTRETRLRFSLYRVTPEEKQNIEGGACILGGQEGCHSGTKGVD